MNPIALIFMVIFAGLFAVLIAVTVTGGGCKAHAQVEVKQSSTINGQTTITKSWSNEQKVSIQDGAKADLTLKPGELKIHYCNEDNHCHDYTIWNNGTITKDEGS